MGTVQQVTNQLGTNNVRYRRNNIGGVDPNFRLGGPVNYAMNPRNIYEQPRTVVGENNLDVRRPGFPVRVSGGALKNSPQQPGYRNPSTGMVPDSTYGSAKGNMPTDVGQGDVKGVRRQPTFNPPDYYGNGPGQVKLANAKMLGSLARGMAQQEALSGTTPDFPSSALY